MSQSLDYFHKASEVVKSLATHLEGNTLAVLSLLVTAAFLALVPSSFFPDEVINHRWIFYAVAIFLCSYCSLWVWNERDRIRKPLWMLKHLGVDERAILVEYLKQNKSVSYFNLLNGPVLSLVQKGILSFPSSLVPPINAPVAIQPFILLFLKKHPETIGLKADEIGSEKLSNPKEGGLKFPNSGLHHTI